MRTEEMKKSLDVVGRAFVSACSGQVVSGMIRTPFRWLVDAHFKNPYIAMLEGVSSSVIFRILNNTIPAARRDEFEQHVLESIPLDYATRMLGYLKRVCRTGAGAAGGFATSCVLDALNYDNSDFARSDSTVAYRNTIICLVAILTSWGVDRSLDKLESFCKKRHEPSPLQDNTSSQNMQDDSRSQRLLV